MKFLKIIGFILLGMIVFLGGQIAGTNLKYQLDIAKSRRNVEKAQEMLLEPYKNDVYGGSTPQETFDLFLDALKKDDLELASKYFTSRRQEKGVIEHLKRLRNEDGIESYIQELGNAKATWEEVRDDFYDWEERAKLRYKKIRKSDEKVMLPDGAGGSIEYTLSAGEYFVPIEFEKNPYTNIWKIDIL